MVSWTDILKNLVSLSARTLLKRFVCFLQISGLPVVPGGPVPSFNVLNGFPGLTVRPVAVVTPIALVPGTGIGGGEPIPCPMPIGGATCGWTAQFALTSAPTSGILNRQISIDIFVNGAQKANLPVLLNLNCAPQFQSITAQVNSIIQLSFPCHSNQI